MIKVERARASGKRSDILATCLNVSRENGTMTAMITPTIMSDTRTSMSENPALWHFGYELGSGVSFINRNTPGEWADVDIDGVLSCCDHN